ncbi:hypothetical protein AK812_SmicGene19173 [Symbiodinium microadriaticum]|uniref:Uncharacterized protein n=1 Tax=Symbiodinium microadriaticum TaxID=2951 RepID=A0A1Q9DT88_SYMMI|nr:hypothetical protein AK812_SmicGene19173 [Symbiodinium microadriaticum]
MSLRPGTLWLNDVHGCPFKQMDPKALQQQLQRLPTVKIRWRVPSAYVGEIERLIKEGKRYQEACIEYFKPRAERAGAPWSAVLYVAEAGSTFFLICEAKDAAKGESAGNPAPVAVLACLAFAVSKKCCAPAASKLSDFCRLGTGALLGHLAWG